MAFNFRWITFKVDPDIKEMILTCTWDSGGALWTKDAVITLQSLDQIDLGPTSNIRKKKENIMDMPVVV